MWKLLEEIDGNMKRIERKQKEEYERKKKWRSKYERKCDF